jgi:hypothetical protein
MQLRALYSVARLVYLYPDGCFPLRFFVRLYLSSFEMRHSVYYEAFHLNDTELDLIAGLVPPGQILIRKAQSSTLTLKRFAPSNQEPKLHPGTGLIQGCASWNNLTNSAEGKGRLK